MPSDVDTMRDDMGRGSVHRERARPRGGGGVGRRGIGLGVLLGLLVLLGAPAAAAQDVRLHGKVRAGARSWCPRAKPCAATCTHPVGSSAWKARSWGTSWRPVGRSRCPGRSVVTSRPAGGTVDISGRVGGDARIAAGRVTVGGPVAEDLVLGAGQVTLTPSARIGQDLVFGAGQMTVDGRVDGNVLGSTGSYTRRGSVGGSEDVRVERPQRAPAAPTLGDRILHGVQRLVAVLAVAALLLWLLPRLLTGAATAVRRRPLASLGVGVLGMIAAVVVAIA
ncbi:MAG: hypothetical protein ACM3ZF_06010, partial [Mycobacterium leprae]